DRPGSRRQLVRAQDLFQNDPGPRRKRAEPLKVLSGIGESINVVNSQAVNQPAVEPAFEQGMCVGKDFFILDPDTSQRGNAEKTAIIEFAIAAPPKGQAIVLLLDQVVERRRIMVDFAQRNGD